MIMDNYSAQSQDQATSPPPTPSGSAHHIEVAVYSDLEKPSGGTSKLGEFLEWKWRWLFAILVCFFLPLLIVVVPSKFALWIILNLVGFVYVSGVNCGRRDPLSSRDDNGSRELVKLLIVAPLIYLLAPYWTLLDSSTEYKDITFFHLSFTGFEYYFLYMYTCYIIPFMIGLHVTYLENLPFFADIALSKEGFARSNYQQRIFLIVLLIVATLIVLVEVYLIAQHGKLPMFSLLLLCGFAVFSVSWFYEIKFHGGRLHIHPFQLSAFLIVFTCVPNAASAVMQGLLVGVYIEGVARWRITGCYQ